MKQKKHDVLIIGAGLVGLLTGYVLSKNGLSVGIVDREDFTTPKFIDYDFRTTAISEGSKIYLESVDIWKNISKHCQKIKKINVFDRNQTNRIEFQNQDIDSYLGYIVKNKYIKKAVIKKLLFKKNVVLYAKSILQNIDFSNDYNLIQTNKNIFKAKLLVAADGKNSLTRKIVKTPIFFKDYKHKALVLNLSHNINHNNTAYELFFKSGPLAILPMKKNYSKTYNSSIVWTHSAEYFNNLILSKKRTLKPILEEKLQGIIGEITNIKEKKLFDLSAHLNSTFFGSRLIFIGDAAHSIHPIAGQGWNLGVRDIKSLSESIIEGMSLGLDPGSEHICKKYNDARYFECFCLYQITDKLNSIFIDDNFILKNLRKIGLEIINNNRKINNMISNYAMGKKIFPKIN